MSNIYGDIPQKYWHNGILSLEDGYLGYRMQYDDLPDSMDVTRGKLLTSNYKRAEDTEYSVHIEGNCIYNCKPNYYKKSFKNKYIDIEEFLICIDKVLKLMNRYEADPICYLGFNTSDF